MGCTVNSGYATTKFLHEDACKHITEMGDTSISTNLNLLRESKNEPSEQGRESVWLPPPQGVVQINIDAALNVHNSRVGWEAAARNWNGNAIITWAWPEKLKGGAEVEEALAIRQSLATAIRKGWKAVQIQSDCKALVDKL
ncbi:hypothetical protein ACH5RR_015677 [Cinchona calisaya]|uniref:RNase H type-1 domain-containing protein n=1 Tax=Cinchona calisaya TaxID=153742 RepID=A0ABD2ZZ82_9GENT